MHRIYRLLSFSAGRVARLPVEDPSYKPFKCEASVSQAPYLHGSTLSPLLPIPWALATLVSGLSLHGTRMPILQRNCMGLLNRHWTG